MRRSEQARTISGSDFAAHRIEALSAPISTNDPPTPHWTKSVSISTTLSRPNADAPFTSKTKSEAPVAKGNESPSHDVDRDSFV